jgi:tryptophan halogenase
MADALPTAPTPPSDDPDRASVVKVTHGASTVVVQFGRWTAEGPEPAEIDVSMTRAIVMPPETAASLLDALNDALREIEARGGPARPDAGAPAEVLPPPVTEPARAGSVTIDLPVRPPRPKSAAIPAAGRRALDLVARLGAPYGHERSFRICEGALLPHRFLLSFEKSALSGAPDARALALCRELGMPEAFLAAAEERLGDARFLHVGFEEGPGGSLLKVYLELGSGLDAGRAAAVAGGGEPVLLHLAFKWDPDDAGRSALTRYFWRPGLGADAIRARLAEIYAGTGHDESREIAEAVLAQAARRVPAEELQYLEVSEDGGGRRSFDLNVYDARLVIRDVKPVVSRMRRRFGVSPGRLQELYDPIKNLSLGHVAGGVHRDGEDFFNVYYGAVKHPAKGPGPR